MRLNNQLEKLKEAEEHQTNYMWDEYEITPHSAYALRKEEYDNLPSLKKMITEVKDEIRKLGDVNVNAIEEYKEVQERYTFLKTQHDDLVEAEQTLISIIEELDAGMRKQFTEKFEQIRIEFDKAFKELFGGGTASLSLSDPENILTSGIDILVHPPGKIVVHLDALSGGEKALVAIALYFAIMKVRPAPFCVMDEIEAALDDVNVYRFASYLRRMTDKTQFILITHRRGTMEEADVLYGVTMQDEGISKLLELRSTEIAAKLGIETK
jgi:chromosome segregation protein